MQRILLVKKTDSYLLVDGELGHRRDVVVAPKNVINLKF